jgi:hypothetical protein
VEDGEHGDPVMKVPIQVMKGIATALGTDTQIRAFLHGGRSNASGMERTSAMSGLNVITMESIKFGHVPSNQLVGVEV